MNPSWHVIGLHHVAIAHGDDPTCETRSRRSSDRPRMPRKGRGSSSACTSSVRPSVQTLEATGDGVVRRFLDKRGPGLHHIAFEVDAIEPALVDLDGRGVQLIDREARAGGMGTRIAFLHPAAFGGVLVELVEERRRADASIGAGDG